MRQSFRGVVEIQGRPQAVATQGLANKHAMRNGQNKRMRGRNRKSHNPLTRVYESNGPDIKIRGTANHVAEKYVQLARDAQASGDPVAAENYYQHAEHYFRMIAAVQDQFRQNQPNFYRPEGGATGNDTHGGNDMQDESFDDGEDEGAGAPVQQGSSGEQPSFGTRDPQPYLPPNAQFYSPREQQYGGRPPPGGERHQRSDEGNVDRLPSFITGGQPPPQQQPAHQGAPGNPGQPNGYDGQGERPQGDRFPMHRRRRRHRGPRSDMPRGGVQEAADDAGPGE
jgi:hypothetical protein